MKAPGVAYLTACRKAGLNPAEVSIEVFARVYLKEMKPILHEQWRKAYEEKLRIERNSQPVDSW